MTFTRLALALLVLAVGAALLGFTGFAEPVAAAARIIFLVLLAGSGTLMMINWIRPDQSHRRIKLLNSRRKG